MSGPTKSPENSIPIGDGKWIEYVELAGRYDSAADIDHLLNELDPLWNALETECVSTCCGMDAFDFSPENLASAASKLNAAEICVKLQILQAQLSALGGVSVFVSKRLNNYSDRSVFEALLGHIKASFCAMRRGA